VVAVQAFEVVQPVVQLVVVVVVNLVLLAGGRADERQGDEPVHVLLAAAAQTDLEVALVVAALAQQPPGAVRAQPSDPAKVGRQVGRRVLD